MFDKALTETTFCEIYADLCFQLNSLLPSFEPESQDGRKRTSTFRSVVWPISTQASDRMLAPDFDVQDMKLCINLLVCPLPGLSNATEMSTNSQPQHSALKPHPIRSNCRLNVKAAELCV